MVGYYSLTVSGWQSDESIPPPFVIMKGRPKTTNADKRLRGTDQRVRMDKEAPAAEPLTVDQITLEGVEGLPTERSRKIYETRCKSLAAMGVMEESYQEQMILYARWLDLAFKASSELEKGLVSTVYNEEGKVSGFIRNPYLGILDMATKNVNDIGRQFGFTAITRNNIKQKEKEIDPVAELQKLIGK